jgi:hypothetical protein
MAQTDRADLESRLARGIANEPMMGTKIVRRTMFSTLMFYGHLPWIYG